MYHMYDVLVCLCVCVGTVSDERVWRGRNSQEWGGSQCFTVKS